MVVDYWRVDEKCAALKMACLEKNSKKRAVNLIQSMYFVDAMLDRKRTSLE